jgi:hypothetical protein
LQSSNSFTTKGTVTSKKQIRCLERLDIPVPPRRTFAFFVVNLTNKKPAELYAPAGLNLVLAANRASHTRRRAMRVMVVVMVHSQHEVITVRDGEQRVNSEKSMRLIGIGDAEFHHRGTGHREPTA